jgi:hypothetical protein
MAAAADEDVDSMQFDPIALADGLEKAACDGMQYCVISS